MSGSDEETSLGIEKRKMKIVLAVTVVVIPAIAIGAFATGMVGGGGSGTPSAEAGGGGSGSGSGSIQVTEVVADPSGPSNAEDVVLKNTGGSAVDMSGWTVSDEGGHTYTVPSGFTLPAGETVTLNTEDGTDSESDLYWGSGSPIWNNGGDTVTVRGSDGTVVAEKSY